MASGTPEAFALGVLAIVLVWVWLNTRSKSKLNLPPGPVAYPVIGSVVEVASADPDVPFIALHKLAKKYGSVMSIKLGSVRSVVFSGYDAIKEMQANPDFSNRMDDQWVLDKTGGLKRGLIFSHSDYWVETRRVTHNLLKEFGFVKASTLEGLIIEELKAFSEELKSKMRNGDAVVEISDTFKPLYMNTVLALVTGTRREHDDPELLEILDLGNTFLASSQIAGGICGLFPQLMYIFPNWSGYTKCKKIQIGLKRYMENLIAKYRNLGTYKNAPANFVECFLQLIDEQPGGPRDNIGELESPYSDLNLVGVLQDLLLGAADTSSSTTNFGIRYLVQNPHMQAKMFEEIDRVLGKDRWVSVEDKPNLKYTQAVILESLRLSTAIPIPFPRKTYKDCRFRNYDIPKGTAIVPNLWGANMDEKVWENPEVFNPERFLDANGNIINSEKLLTFGIGLKVCIGQVVAKTNLLMAFTSLIQQFSFEADPASGIPLNLNEDKLTRTTKPYKILIKLRH